MAQWYVKKLSQLTHVSVKTLYHYESIGLLKPSMRLENGYRVYTESDLLRLQQILALKSFGFGLAQIKQLLNKRGDVTELLLLQSRFLDEKAQSLIDASRTLKTVAAELGDGKTVAWETIIKLIEVYNMTTKLKNGWAGQIMNDDQLKEYAEFSEELKARFTEADKIAWEKKWSDLAGRVRAHLSDDPEGPIGVEIGKQCMEMVNHLYGNRFALRKTVWEEGYRKGKIDPAHTWAEPVVVEWLNIANRSYYYSRLTAIVNAAAEKPEKAVDAAWKELLVEVCAEDTPAMVAQLLLDDKRLSINAAGKHYLEGILRKHASSL